jgi:hypothetical protein
MNTCASLCLSFLAWGMGLPGGNRNSRGECCSNRRLLGTGELRLLGKHALVLELGLLTCNLRWKSGGRLPICGQAAQNWGRFRPTVAKNSLRKLSKDAAVLSVAL